MPLELKIGLDAITSYKRLAYTPWHALAEFVDNSTQSYFDNRAALDQAFAPAKEVLHVTIAYDLKAGFLRVADNSIGMSYHELQRALHVAQQPANNTGRSKYGMGLKTAACWIGNYWTIRTKKLGETTEHFLEIDVQNVSAGAGEIPYTTTEGKNPEEHYTVIEIREHNQRFQGRTLSKIRTYLSSMYREDFRNGILKLEWQGTTLSWQEPHLLKAHDGSTYKKDFDFTIDGKHVDGWVGILARGSRADAGFSILHCGRVVRGYPDSWRPASLYGQLQGSNDLVNQRLVGEINLDAFDVSHTKDDILWLGDQEEVVEEELAKHCAEYRTVAKEYRKGKDEERGPSDLETEAAVQELKKELESAEMVDAISVDLVLPQQVVDAANAKLAEAVTARPETFRAAIGTLTVKIYLEDDRSPYEPYIVVDSTSPTTVLVIINTNHPHWSMLKGSDGVLNYLRHCTYDAIAEWQARQKVGRLDPTTIKLLKDKLLRIPFDIEARVTDEGAEVSMGA